MKTFRTHSSVARSILEGKEATLEKPLSNKEAQQNEIETPADIVMRKYCTKGYRKAELQRKIIDNA